MKMQSKKRTSPSEGRKTFTVILSVVIALSLWAYVIGEVNPTIRQPITNVPVQLLNVQSLHARELAIAGDTRYTVDVVVEGKRSDILKVGSEEILAEADLFGWSKGENFIPVNVRVPDTLHIIEVKAAKIQVTIEDQVALSRPVVVLYAGELPAHTEEGALEIKPAEIEVTGAKSDVEAVVRIQAVINASELTADGKTIQAEAVPVNYAGVPVESVKLSANYVSVFAKLYHLKEVPLTAEFTGELREGYGLETLVPGTVLIKGSKNALKDITSVSAEPVDVSGLTAGGSVDLRIPLPEGVELAKGYETLKAEVSIVEVGTRTFRYSSEEILIQGLTEGKTAAIDAVSFEVTAVGRKETVAALTKDQVKLYIDVTGVPLGTQNLTVSASYEGILQKVSVDPGEVAVTVKNTE